MKSIAAIESVIAGGVARLRWLDFIAGF